VAFVTVGTENLMPSCMGQIFKLFPRVLLVMSLGCPGTPEVTVTAFVAAKLSPQLFLAITLTVPFPVPEVTVIVLVPLPAVIFHPGALQVYSVAYWTSGMVKVIPEVEAQTLDGPSIVAFIIGAGGLIAT